MIPLKLHLCLRTGTAMKRVWSIASLLIIILIGITSFISAKGVFDALAIRQVDSWFSNRPIIFTSQLTDKQKGIFVSELQGLVSEGGFVAIGRNDETLQSGAALYTFSVLPTRPNEGATIDALSILETTVVDGSAIDSVVAGEANCYAGYGNDSFSRVSDLPSIRSGLYFRVDKMNSGEDLGDSCAFFGLDYDDFQTLVDRLSSAVGVSSETLTTKMSGATSEIGLIYFFCAGALVLLSLVLCLLMVARSLLELKTLGVHLMLGWSRVDFASNLLFPQALQLLCLVPIGVIGTLAVFDGFTIGADLAKYAFISMLPAAMAILASMLVAVIPLFFTKPVETIHGRYSRRGFYILTAAVYLVCLIAIFAGCLYIDQPLSMYTNLARVQSTWQQYEGWYVVRDFRLDNARFTGNPMDLSGDLYAWYSEHEHDEGVYLANTKHYEEAPIQRYVGDSATLKPFWYLAASPSYLEQIGVDVPADLIEKANQGVRVHLLPNTLSAAETDEMKDLLIASRKPVDSNIVTTFMENPTYEFAPYDSDNELFTWSTDDELPLVSNGFVIAVITAENMVPFESESLVSSGLDNAYIKLDSQAASNLLDADGRAELNGSMNARFATVGNYIDGIQKSLEELFALFSIVLMVLMTAVVVMVMCLIDVANRVNAKEISVKYILGCGLWGLYRREILFVSLTALIGICTSIVLRSRAGVLVGVALLFISLFAIGVVSRKRSTAVVLETISKE